MSVPTTRAEACLIIIIIKFEVLINANKTRNVKPALIVKQTKSVFSFFGGKICTCTGAESPAYRKTHKHNLHLNFASFRILIPFSIIYQIETSQNNSFSPFPPLLYNKQRSSQGKKQAIKRYAPG